MFCDFYGNRQYFHKILISLGVHSKRTRKVVMPMDASVDTVVTTRVEYDTADTETVSNLKNSSVLHCLFIH